MARETITIFEGLELSADEARRAIRVHMGADVIWEWRTDADDTAEDDILPEGFDVTYHAGVTSGTGGTERAFVARGASGREALEDVLWDVVLDAMLVEDAPAFHKAPQPVGRA